MKPWNKKKASIKKAKKTYKDYNYQSKLNFCLYFVMLSFPSKQRGKLKKQQLKILLKCVNYCIKYININIDKWFYGKWKKKFLNFYYLFNHKIL